MPPISVDSGSEIDVSRTPSGPAEQNQLERGAKLKNDSDEQDMDERKRYADNAYGITQAWVGFIIVLTIMQFSLKPSGMGLGTTEFVTVITTTTASILGFWMLVGRYLFNPKGNGDK